jgi:Tfp pilus assembly protein PilV
MRRRRGFTLIEASISGAILMIGVISLINISRTSMNQITEMRVNQGHPAIAESLVHDQIEALRANPAAQVPPIVLDGLEYRVAVSLPVLEAGMSRYAVSVTFKTAAFKAGVLVAPPVYVWR